MKAGLSRVCSVETLNLEIWKQECASCVILVQLCSPLAKSWAMYCGLSLQLVAWVTFSQTRWGDP